MTQQTARPAPRRRRADMAGVALSIACIIHCLAGPLLLALSPALARGLHWPADTHLILLLMVIPLAAWTIGRGWWLHRRSSVAMLALLGAAGLMAGVLLDHDHSSAAATAILTPSAMATLAGALALAAAHIANWRARPHH